MSIEIDSADDFQRDAKGAEENEGPFGRSVDLHAPECPWQLFILCDLSSSDDLSSTEIQGWKPLLIEGLWKLAPKDFILPESHVGSGSPLSLLLSELEVSGLVERSMCGAGYHVTTAGVTWLRSTSSKK